MDIEMIMQHLTQAREHVALGERHIARQHEIIAEIKLRGADPKEVERLLAAFEQSQAMHLSHRDRLDLQLAGLKEQ
jgi:endonuclease/exonuclease/phosphatase family metal-dependent hydrolase